MFKLFLADLKQLKKPFLFLVLSIPLLHYLDSLLFYYVLPTKLNVSYEGEVFQANEFFSGVSGWLFAIMASVILILFSEETGGGLQSRLPSLVSLPLSRWKIGLLRHLPALLVIPALGLILNGYRILLAFFRAISLSDLWVHSRTLEWNTTVDAFIWACNKILNVQGTGPASLLFQIGGWISMSLFILGIPLLIDDVWPNIKRSSFALWLCVSLFIGLSLQVGVLMLSKHLGMEMYPHFQYPSIGVVKTHPWLPSLMSIELLLALGVMGLELWRFERRKSYV